MASLSDEVQKRIKESEEELKKWKECRIECLTIDVDQEGAASICISSPNFLPLEDVEESLKNSTKYLGDH